MADLEDTDTIMINRYQRAAKFIDGAFSNNLVRNATVFPVWLENTDCFWYERAVFVSGNKEAAGTINKEFRIVNASTSSNKLAFDHEEMASLLASHTGESINAGNLPINNVKMIPNLRDLSRQPIAEVHFNALGREWQFNVSVGTCEEIRPLALKNERLSPDRKKVAFKRDHNLWLRNLENGEEKQLTTDGEADLSYAEAGSAWGHETEIDLEPQAIFSPDSSFIFTVQRDRRQVKSFPVLNHVPTGGNVRPTVDYCKIAFPGDEHVETLRVVAINCHTYEVRPAHYPQIPTTRNSYGFFSSELGWWGKDSRRAYFIDVDSNYKTARLVEFDVATGSTRILFEETSETHINLMLNADERPALKPLPDSDELLWFSERNGWAHLYIYCLENGQLKKALTQGNWLVRDIIYFNAEKRELFVQTAGRVEGRDPYYRDLCRINIDTGELTTLVSGDFECNAVNQKSLNTILARTFGNDVSSSCAVSPTGNFAVVTKSRADQVPVTFLVNQLGERVCEIETADISDLPENWQWPEPVKLLAADDSTNLYGLVFRPSDFSAEKSYPLVMHVFANPELPWVSKGSFANGTAFGYSYLEAAALAELGFIVVQIDSRGTACWKKSFHDESYGWIESAANLEDYVAGVRQLGEKYDYIDIDRVGITNHSSGGPGPVQGLLRYPDFFKVGVSSNLHDSRLMSRSMWADKFEGGKADISKYDYPESLVGNLSGKLLLMHGMLDTTSPPACTFRLIAALEKANKDFDMILLPTAAHAIPRYLVRRAWDYLIRNLLEKEPPKEFQL